MKDLAIDLTVIMITHNCARELHKALSSVSSLQAHIVIVDAGSQDGTVQEAQRWGAQVIQQEWQGYALQKNRALQEVRTSWVLWLDSDEVLTSAGVQAIRRVVKQEEESAEAYLLHRRTTFLDRWMDHCWGNEFVLRLFRWQPDRCFESKDLVHERLLFNGFCRPLPGCVIEHHPYRDLSHYFQKFVNYAQLHAQQKMCEQHKPRLVKLVYSAPATFLKLYVLKQGFRDGWQGFVLCMCSAFHSFVKTAWHWQLWHKAHSTSHQELDAEQLRKSQQ